MEVHKHSISISIQNSAGGSGPQRYTNILCKIQANRLFSLWQCIQMDSLKELELTLPNGPPIVEFKIRSCSGTPELGELSPKQDGPGLGGWARSHSDSEK